MATIKHKSIHHIRAKRPDAARNSDFLKHQRRAAEDRASTALWARVSRTGLSVAEVAERTGYSEGAIKKMRAGESGMTLAGFLTLGKVLGPDFVNEILSEIGMGGAHEVSGVILTPCRVTLAAVQIAAIRAETDADGIRELPELLREVKTMRPHLPTLTAYAAMSDTDLSRFVGRVS